MKNNLIILGAVALGIYLMTRKKEKKVYTKELLMAMSDADLQALLIDLGNKASQNKYLDPAAYSYMVVTEIERRKKTSVVNPNPGTITPTKATTSTSVSYGPSTGVALPMSF